ncbi:MAG: hypothetical protein J3Q66DRAFT_367664 [Benniella sp.]|nr:MAG: hypothetical protein J3Q66DRAFT_367664 [Benniella sp.]
MACNLYSDPNDPMIHISNVILRATRRGKDILSQSPVKSASDLRAFPLTTSIFQVLCGHGVFSLSSDLGVTKCGQAFRDQNRFSIIASFFDGHTTVDICTRHRMQFCKPVCSQHSSKKNMNVSVSEADIVDEAVRSATEETEAKRNVQKITRILKKKDSTSPNRYSGVFSTVLSIYMRQLHRYWGHLSRMLSRPAVSYTIEDKAKDDTEHIDLSKVELRVGLWSILDEPDICNEPTRTRAGH